MTFVICNFKCVTSERLWEMWPLWSRLTRAVHICVSPGSQSACGLQPSGLLLHLLHPDLVSGAAAEDEGPACLHPVRSDHRLPWRAALYTRPARGYVWIISHTGPTNSSVVSAKPVSDRCWETVLLFVKLNRLHLLLPAHLPGGTFPSDQHFHHLPAGADWHALFWRDRLVQVIHRL